MSGFADGFGIATSALTAYQAGLNVVGQNIANVNTPGYSRRAVILGELAPVDPASAGRGVEILKIQAQRDQAIDARIGQEQAGLAHDQATLGGLKEVESAIGAPGSSIDQDLTAFFDAFSQFSNDVTSPAARDLVVKQGQVVAQSFKTLSGRISQLQASTDAAVRDDVAQLNALTAQVAQLNAQISTNHADVDTLKDQRAAVLEQVSAIADIRVLPRTDGGVDVTLPQGQALVIGATSYDVQTTPAPPNGAVTLQLGNVDITSQVTSGELGGLLHLRDSVLPGYQGRLDQLAYDLATAVNAVHTTGYDANGNPAGTFFVPPTAVAGTASSLTVEAAVVADSRLVAGSATGAPGDNQTALALAGLRNQRVLSGGTATPAEAWSNFVYAVGSDVATATSGTATRDSVVRQLQQLRDQASGVSLDEEAANLMKFQRAYEASARYFTTVLNTLDSLMNMVA